jgi:hypothetical protein
LAKHLGNSLILLISFAKAGLISISGLARLYEYIVPIARDQMGRPKPTAHGSLLHTRSLTHPKEAAVTAHSTSMNVKVGIEHGGNRMFVKSGGTLDIEAGGVLSQGGAPLKFARGQLTTVTAPRTRSRQDSRLWRPSLRRWNPT